MSAVRIGLVCVLVLGACEGASTATLIVDVQTDLIPGVEFGAARVVIDNTRQEDEAVAISGENWGTSPKRVARFEGIEDDSVTARVQLFLAGEVVVERPFVSALSGTTGVTVVLTRRCVGIACPGDGTPNQTACLGQRCVDPRCLTGDESLCNEHPPECEIDSQCPQPVCATAECISGVCIVTDGTCGGDEYCAPESGCRPLPTTTDMDAGSNGGRDAGSDSGISPDSEPVVDAEVDAGTDSGADAAFDSAVEVGPDTSAQDTSVDTNASDVGSVALSAPILRFPPLGHQLGSAHAPPSSGGSPRQPKVMWEPVSGATRYNVQFDASCTDRNCDFSSPEADLFVTGAAAPTGGALEHRLASPLPVRMTPPVGERYYWRVRACTEIGCGPFGEIRYVDVGRSPSDLNGDGYSDLAVGARFDDQPENDEGAVHIYYGNSAGTFAAAADLVIDNPDNEENGHFGYRVTARGDLNGDGFCDLVASATDQDATMADEGAVFVFLGGATGPNAEAPLVFRATTSMLEGRFGTGISTAGDFNGDGFADLCIGSVGRATVSFYAGSPSGPSPTAGIHISDPDGNAGSWFGEDCDFGDLNGDGYAELIGAAPESEQGGVFVFNGGSMAVPALSVISLRTGQGGPFSRFGTSINARGDLNGDGLMDLAVGGQFAHTNGEGGVDVFYGAQPMPALLAQSHLRGPSGQADLHMGVDVSNEADLNGDGFDDLVVGAWLYDDGMLRDAGGAFLYLGGVSSVTGEPDRIFASPVRGDFFGAGIAMCEDLNGDGNPDLAITGPSTRSAVDLWFGSGALPPISASTTIEYGFGDFGSAVGG